jgi:periplasmic copper chaperone A
MNPRSSIPASWPRRRIGPRGVSIVAVAATFATVTLWAGTAAAHVSVSPSSLPQGTSDAILTFRVPNESATASVTGLQIRFPLDHPIVVLSPQAGSGWNVSVHSSQLPKPITTDDGTFTSTVSEIDWSGGSIPVGQFGLFNVLAQGLPSGTNQLVFKAVQDYSDGTTVAWIQVPDRSAPDPPHPAPMLTLTPAAGASTSAPAITTAGGSATSSGSSGGDHALALGALIGAGFAVVIAVLAVWLGRPRVYARTDLDDRQTVDTAQSR